MSPAKPLDVAIVGAGWAGLAAAIDCADRGDRVSVYEMAPQAGGRARSTTHRGATFDNGQHIMIGAYLETFDLMRRVGVDLNRALLRTPLALVDPAGRGLRLPHGRTVPAFVRGVLGARHWPWAARIALLRTAARWQRQGFVAPPAATVASLLKGVPAAIVRDFFDPLCIAALNTPAEHASASVFLRVLKDALFSGPGSSDLVLPRWPLSRLFPEPAADTLTKQGAFIHWRSRVRALRREADAWHVDADGVPSKTFDAVILACSATEAARLAQTTNPAWARCAAAVQYQSIVTVYAARGNPSSADIAPPARARTLLSHPMIALASDERHPAQFVFDYAHLGGPSGRLGFVVSGANSWLERGLDAVVAATLDQARTLRSHGQPWASSLMVEHAVAERRATFACTPTLDRPAASVAAGLFAAGDYVEGPYPATLEGAVRAGRRAAALMPRQVANEVVTHAGHA